MTNHAEKMLRNVTSEKALKRDMDTGGLCGASG